VFENLADGLTRGIEAWASWQVVEAWRLSGGGVVQRVGTSLQPGSHDLSGTTGLFTSDPNHYWSVRSSYDLGGGHEFDITLRHVGALPKPAVPAYTAVDARYGWRIGPGLDVSVIGQNLFDPGHAEFGAPATRSEYERALAVRLVWTH
jgi:iron complex outermembrane recepter protein